MPWTVVIPLKPPGVGKTRLGSDAALARAIALDTVEAASRATLVDRVIVVTADETLTELDAMAGVELVLEPRSAGIASAIARGFTRVDRGDPRGALLGDLPGLVPADLDATLALALGFDRGFVRDADGSGTTLVTARSGIAFEQHFGPGSAAAHGAAGFVELAVPAGSSLRYDVDDAAQLEALARRGLGPRTTALLGTT